MYKTIRNIAHLMKSTVEKSTYFPTSYQQCTFTIQSHQNTGTRFSSSDPGPLGGVKGFLDRGDSGGHVGERIFRKDPLGAELGPFS